MTTHDTRTTDTALPELSAEMLYQALDWQRRKRHMSWRAVTRDAQLPPGSSASNIISRLGRGRLPGTYNTIRLLLWLGTTDFGPFLLPRPTGRST